jgi:hypothetical protein
MVVLTCKDSVNIAQNKTTGRFLCPGAENGFEVKRRFIACVVSFLGKYFEN